MLNSTRPNSNILYRICLPISLGHTKMQHRADTIKRFPFGSSSLNVPTKAIPVIGIATGYINISNLKQFMRRFILINPKYNLEPRKQRSSFATIRAKPFQPIPPSTWKIIILKEFRPKTVYQPLNHL